MARLNWSRIGLHVLFWAVYLALNAALTCTVYRQPLEEAFWGMLAGEAFSLPIKMAFTYFVFYYIIPLYLERHKLTQLLLSILLGFMATMLAYRFVIVFVYNPVLEPDKTFLLFDGRGLLLTAFDIFITAAAASTIKLIRVHYKSRDFEQQLIREKLQSEINFLRAQTNPHFLFNTLNNLYVLARKKSDHTPDAILMLSKIMRFMLYDCRAPLISLTAEARVIQDYIELEKLRYNKRLTVTYESEMDQPDASIAPLLLLPFVENSFKHGAHSTTGKAAIHIRLQLKNNVLHFSVENTAEGDENRPNPNGEGIGLKNIRRQLDLIYPHQHKLHLTRANGWFRAELNVQLSEN